jgi:hypothetical protein
MDDKSSFTNGDCPSVLKVVCGPPGIGAKKNQESSRKSFVSTYIGGVVALEYGIVDLHIGITDNINSSALEVACPPPGIERKFETVFWVENARMDIKSRANEATIRTYRLHQVLP